MKVCKRLILGLVGMFFCIAVTQAEKMAEQIHDVDANSRDGHIQSLAPLATIGEKINVLIRVKKAAPYTAHLVFVERQDWPEHKQQRLRELYDGQGRAENFGQSGLFHYPIKLRFQLDSVDAPLPVHVDIIHEQRDLTYGTYYPTRYPKLPDGHPSVIWRAQGLWGIRNLEPGVYRIRIENLTPCPEIDFETLLQFYVNHRKA
jgi:hypothetical protein